MSKYSYFYRDREISERAALDQNGSLRDGVAVRVRMQMRDARITDLQRAVAADTANRRPVFDAFGHPAGHRPGAVFTNDRAARDAKAAAYRQYDEEIGRAWEQTNPRGKSEAATGAGEHGQGSGDRQACFDCSGHDATCSTCNGKGFISRDDADADAALEAAFQQTQTYHEGGRRLDAMMRDHQSTMQNIYDAYDKMISEQYRRMR
jgi:hypothetical protein